MLIFVTIIVNIIGNLLGAASKSICRAVPQATIWIGNLLGASFQKYLQGSDEGGHATHTDNLPTLAPGGNRETFTVYTHRENTRIFFLHVFSGFLPITFDISGNLHYEKTM